MNYWNAFWVGGTICAVCQIFIDRTKLTPARILVALVVTGVFLEAVGIAAVLWVLFDWFMYPKRAVNVPVQVPLSGDAEELEPLLRRLAGLTVVLLDEGLSDEGRRKAEQAARRDPNITLKKRGETHGGTQYH